MKQMQQLMESTNSVYEANEKLKATIRERKQQIDQAHLDLANVPEQVKIAKRHLREASHRLKKYQKQVSRRTKGIALNKIRSEIDRLTADLDTMKVESGDAKERVDEEQLIINHIFQMNDLKRELVSMNKKLREEVYRLMNLMDVKGHPITGILMKKLDKLHTDMLAGERMRRELIEYNTNLDKSEDSDVFRDIDEKLKQAVPIFNQLEKLLGSQPLRSSRMSRLSSGQLSEMCSDLLGSDRTITRISDGSGSALSRPGTANISRLDLSRIIPDFSAKSARVSVAPFRLSELTMTELTRIDFPLSDRSTLERNRILRRSASADNVRINFTTEQNNMNRTAPVDTHDGPLWVRSRSQNAGTKPEYVTVIDETKAKSEKKDGSHDLNDTENPVSEESSVIDKAKEKNQRANNLNELKGQSTESSQSSPMRSSTNKEDDEWGIIASLKNKLKLQDNELETQTNTNPNLLDDFTSTSERERTTKDNMFTSLSSTPDGKQKSTGLMALESSPDPSKGKLNRRMKTVSDLFTSDAASDFANDDLQKRRKSTTQPIMTLQNSQHLFATDTSASPEKKNQKQSNTLFTIDSDSSMSSDYEAKKERITLSSSCGALDKQIVEVKPEKLTIRVFDHNGNRITTPITIDRTGKPVGMRVYDSQGNLITNLKGFMQNFEKSVDLFEIDALPAHKKDNMRANRLSRTTLYVGAQRSSRLGETTGNEDLAMYQSKSRYRQSERTTTRSPEKIMQSSPQRSLLCPSDADSDCMLSETLDPVSGLPIRTSHSWTKFLIQKAINSQLNRTNISVAISDAKVTLAQLEDDVATLSEEKEYLENKRRLETYNPVLSCMNVIDGIFISCEKEEEEEEPVQFTETTTMSNMSGEDIDNMMKEIAVCNEIVAKSFVKEQQKLFADSQYPELQASLRTFREKIAHRQRIICDLETRLSLVLPGEESEAVSQETQIRREFEAARDEKLRSQAEIEAQIELGQKEIKKLENRIADQRFLHKTLRKKISEAQRAARPNVQELCSTMERLRGIEKRNHEMIKHGDNEMRFYENNMEKLHQTINNRTRESAEIDELKAKVAEQKGCFGRQMRTDTHRSVPFTTQDEIRKMTSRTNDINVHLMNLNRREEVIRNKIDKMVKQMNSYRIRVPKCSILEQK